MLRKFQFVAAPAVLLVLALLGACRSGTPNVNAAGESRGPEPGPERDPYDFSAPPGDPEGRDDMKHWTSSDEDAQAGEGTEGEARKIEVSQRDDVEAIDLFDGRTLAGWQEVPVYGRPARVPEFRVDAGNIVNADNNRAFLYTGVTLENFELDVDWRYDPITRQGADGGILLCMAPINVGIPSCVEVDTAALYAGDLHAYQGFQVATNDRRRDNGRQIRKFRQGQAEAPYGQWNRFEITVDSGTIQVRLNGELVNEASIARQVGPIALVSQRGKMQYKNIRLTPLD